MTFLVSCNVAFKSSVLAILPLTVDEEARTGDCLRSATAKKPQFLNMTDTLTAEQNNLFESMANRDINQERLSNIRFGVGT